MKSARSFFSPASRIWRTRSREMPSSPAMSSSKVVATKNERLICRQAGQRSAQTRAQVFNVGGFVGRNRIRVGQRIPLEGGGIGGKRGCELDRDHVRDGKLGDVGDFLQRGHTRKTGTQNGGRRPDGFHAAAVATRKRVEAAQFVEHRATNAHEAVGAHLIGGAVALGECGDKRELADRREIIASDIIRQAAGDRGQCDIDQVDEVSEHGRNWRHTNHKNEKRPAGSFQTFDESNPATSLPAGRS
jgi:hypothetical protein